MKYTNLSVWVNFDIGTHVCNHHPDQDIECSHEYFSPFYVSPFPYSPPHPCDNPGAIFPEPTGQSVTVQVPSWFREGHLSP